MWNNCTSNKIIEINKNIKVISNYNRPKLNYSLKL